MPFSAYHNSVKDAYPEQAQRMAALIDNVKATNGSGDNLEILELCMSILNEGTKVIKTEVARTDLSAAISEGEEYYNSIKESNPEIASVLLIIINAAKQVREDSFYTLSDVELTTAIMKEVIIKAKEAVATGINAVSAASGMTAKYFDLQGRHVAQPKQKGVYIYKYNNKTIKQQY